MDSQYDYCISSDCLKPLGRHEMQLNNKDYQCRVYSREIIFFYREKENSSIEDSRISKRNIQ